jgi:AraC-like DNA-binding protein/ligand-binding sensor protein
MNVPALPRVRQRSCPLSVCGPDAGILPRGLAQSPLVRGSLAEFHRATGLAAKLVPAVLPTRLIRFGTQENDFCRAAVCHPDGCPGCHQAQLTLLRRLGGKLKPQQASCRCGLILLAVPIMVAGRHVATVIGGKVRVGRSGARAFEALLPQLRLPGGKRDLRRLRADYYRVPVLTVQKFRAAVRLLDMLARLFAETVAHPPPARSTTDPPCICEAKQFVRLHLGERLTTHQAAQALHLEESYFCRLFHRLTKMTFHAYVAQARVEQARTLLRNSHERIGQIASDAGFQSASDFNRIFKASVGMTPTDFRRKSR